MLIQRRATGKYCNYPNALASDSTAIAGWATARNLDLTRAHDMASSISFFGTSWDSGTRINLFGECNRHVHSLSELQLSPEVSSLKDSIGEDAMGGTSE